MKREFGRDGATLASASPSIVSWDPLAGELLRGHLEAEGFPGTAVLADHETAKFSTPLVVLPPPSYAEYLGGAWDSLLRGIPLDVPMVVLARPTVPVRAALQLNLRKSGVALLDAGRGSTVAAVPSALRMSLEGGQVIDPLFIPSIGVQTSSELTPAELRVYELLAYGRSNSGIAAELFLSERTVEVHVRKIFFKLGLSDDRSMNRRVVAALLQALPT
jgi:DNA-binding CsgD family transcriptional regulator